MLADPDAQIDIVERNRVPLVEAPDGVENLPAHHHARRGDAREVLFQHAAAVVSSTASRHVEKLVAGGTPETENDAGVLDAVGGVVEHCTYGPDIFHHGACDQFFEPILRDDLDI